MAALAVSITEPPPTARVKKDKVGSILITICIVKLFGSKFIHNFRSNMAIGFDIGKILIRAKHQSPLTLDFKIFALQYDCDH